MSAFHNLLAYIKIKRLSRRIFIETFLQSAKLSNTDSSYASENNMDASVCIVKSSDLS